ncbi:MAG: 3-oxoacyl-ACP reductase FabG [Deltaproteobacteria bacterium]|nr:3-oxoacyl-ACP reductase FabG [Deltaproteobacteria bacterium]
MEGKVAVVTGGSRGIGRGICLSLAREGAAVIVNYFQNKTAADDVVKNIKSYDRKAMSIQADVRRFEEVEHMVEVTLEHFEKIDILVNNAGLVKPLSFLKATREDWHHIIDTHLNGTYNCCKLVLPSMVERKTGRVINISSGIAVTGFHGYASYCAAKAGIISLSKTLAKELASKGIYVNVVAPGFVPTELQDSISPEVRARLLDSIPMKRFGKVEEIAEVVTFLASSGSYINGQVIHVDGGFI